MAFLIHVKQQRKNPFVPVLMLFHKDKLLTVTDSVQVYGEERIEIVWKMNDGFFSAVAGEKDLVTLQ